MGDKGVRKLSGMLVCWALQKDSKERSAWIQEVVLERPTPVLTPVFTPVFTPVPTHADPSQLNKCRLRIRSVTIIPLAFISHYAS